MCSKTLVEIFYSWKIANKNDIKECKTKFIRNHLIIEAP